MHAFANRSSINFALRQTRCIVLFCYIYNTFQISATAWMVSCWASVNLKKIQRTERDDDVVVVVIVVSVYIPWDDCRPQGGILATMIS